MHSLYIEELDKNNNIIPNSERGRRVAVLPRKDELFIWDDKLYVVVRITHDYDTKEHVAYALVQYLMEYPKTSDKPVN